MQNVSLLKKWLWRFCSEDLALWRRFISHKYGLQNNWITEEANACIWWTLWKERNERSHDGKLNNTQKIKMNSLSLLYFWCKQDLVGE
ncbi:hypothetical protein H5410_038583, partial [Solanum commersonii]